MIEQPIICCVSVSAAVATTTTVSGALAYGLLSILVLTPLIGILMVQLPLDPAALALGLGLFAAMPTALSSGVTFTQVRVIEGEGGRGDQLQLDSLGASHHTLPAVGRAYRC